MKNRLLSIQILADDPLQQIKNQWLSKVYRKSESSRSKQVVLVSLNMFRLFCENQGKTESEMIKEYQTYAKDNDFRNVGLSLDNFVQFLNEDHPEIILRKNQFETSFKKKSGKTIRTYFGFVKSYLRICHDVRLTIDDVKDYITFPKPRKEPRRAIDIKILKKIFSNSSPSRRALYSVLISSGMRIGEALALTPNDFHLDENPVRITIDAEITKTKEGRETYISSEAVDKVKPIIETKEDNEKIFAVAEENHLAVIYEEKVFFDLRKKLGLVEKYKNSNRFVVNIHSFRAYFHTKASQKHGSDYANALDGHGAYLKQYYRETPQERAKKYKELESSLFIESYKVEVGSKAKDELIENLQESMARLQDKMTRLEFLNKP